MVFNQLDIHLLITAICVISSALICYTIGVWGERFQGQLKAWHLWFFVLGLYADAIGTGLMEHIAQLTHLHGTYCNGNYRYLLDADPCDLGDLDLL